MDRYAIISIPEAMQIGFAIPLLFFDKILVPDQEHVAYALQTVEQSSPEHYRDYEDYTRSVRRLSWNYNTTTLGLIATVAVEFVDNLAQMK